jgi:hypothetical protein
MSAFTQIGTTRFAVRGSAELERHLTQLQPVQTEHAVVFPIHRALVVTHKCLDEVSAGF